MVYRPLCRNFRKILRVAHSGLLVPVTIKYKIILTISFAFESLISTLCFDVFFLNQENYVDMYCTYVISRPIGTNFTREKEIYFKKSSLSRESKK